MITIVKLGPYGETKFRYQGEILEQSQTRLVLQAVWALPARNLEYVCFEPGDRFIEYYYTDRWFNIFDILDTNGKRKGWYCNIAEPAVLLLDHVEQVDLFLDVWVNPVGETLLLDEDEFASATMLSEDQRQGAQRGLQDLLHMLKIREDAFSDLQPP